MDSPLCCPPKNLLLSTITYHPQLQHDGVTYHAGDPIVITDTKRGPFEFKAHGVSPDGHEWVDVIEIANYRYCSFPLGRILQHTDDNSDGETSSVDAA